MTKLKTILCAAAALSAGALALPANSATITEAISGGPFSGTNTMGGFPLISLNKSNTYDFTFSLVPPLGGDTQEQIQAQSRPTTVAGSPQVIAFDLYSGAPGFGTRIASSTWSTSTTSAFLAWDLSPGAYYVQITDIAKNNEVLSGSLVTVAVPEPASWALMILGIGAIGAALRGRKRLATA
ncbi:MAG TPA: PEPxxWA-CTERM sorting domain-containing protein [Caulobacteraceae bacterium]|jgi:hypothetical protein